MYMPRRTIKAVSQKEEIAFAHVVLVILIALARRRKQSSGAGKA